MRRFGLFRRLSAICIAVVLGGCASGVVSQSSNDLEPTPGVRSEFGYAGSGGDMLVVVVGNPFAMPQAEVESVILASMQGRNVGPAMRFDTARTARMRPGYVVVVMVDSAPGTRPDQLCRDPAALQPQGQTSRMRMLTAFCGGERALSWVLASVPRSASPADPMFRKMVAQSTSMLVPLQDDDRGGRHQAGAESADDNSATLTALRERGR